MNVSGLAGATQIAAGGFHTCAVLVGGGVSCWGGNLCGELGDGSNDFKTTPVQVPGVSGATQVTAGAEVGYGHSCALLSAGTLRCWGANDVGQLGDGLTADTNTAVATLGFQ